MRSIITGVVFAVVTLLGTARATLAQALDYPGTTYLALGSGNPNDPRWRARGATDAACGALDVAYGAVARANPCEDIVSRPDLTAGADRDFVRALNAAARVSIAERVRAAAVLKVWQKSVVAARSKLRDAQLTVRLSNGEFSEAYYDARSGRARFGRGISFEVASGNLSGANERYWSACRDFRRAVDRFRGGCWRR